MWNKILVTITAAALVVVLFPSKISPKRVIPAILGLQVSKNVNVEDQHVSPELVSSSLPPDLTAKSALAFDLDSGALLYTKNLDAKVQIASLTKLMTAITAREFLRSDEKVDVVASDVQVVGSNLGLIPGEQVLAGDLFKALLISSSNDTAKVIARQVGGTEVRFVEMMNRKAESLGLYDTHFDNPVGLDSDGNYSTAVDLSKLVHEFMKDQELVDIVKTSEATVESTDGKYVHRARTTNKLLLERPGQVMGIKTGYTSAAKGNLIILDRMDTAQIITIVLNSDNREEDTRQLLDWILASYKW